MGESGSSVIGDMIVKAGLATRSQVDECVSIQKSRLAEGGTLELLGQIMVERGYISPDQLVAVLQGDPSPRTNRFGDLCVRMGFLTEQEIQDAVEEQQRLRSHGTDMRLGDILIEKQRLSDPQVQAVLGAQGFAIAMCTKCSAECNVDLGMRPEAMRCEKCGGALIIVDSFEEEALAESYERSRAAQPSPAQPEPAQPEPVQPDPVQPEPAQPEPVQPAPEPAAPREEPTAADAAGPPPPDDETAALKEKLAKLEAALQQAHRDAEEKVKALQAQLDVADGIRAVATEERNEVLARLEEAEQQLEEADAARARGEVGPPVTSEDIARLKSELDEREAKLETERQESHRLVAEAEQAREEAETIARSAQMRLQATDEARAGAAAARDEALKKLTEMEHRIQSGSYPVVANAAAPPASDGAALAPGAEGAHPMPVPRVRWSGGAIPPPPARRPPPVRATPKRPVPGVTRPTGLMRNRKRGRALRIALGLLGVFLAALFVLAVCATCAPGIVPSPVLGAFRAMGLVPGGTTGESAPAPAPALDRDDPDSTERPDPDAPPSP